MKKFMSSFAALAASFAAQQAEALPAKQETTFAPLDTEVASQCQGASSQITVGNKNGDLFEFTLERAGNEKLMAYHHSHSSHSSHSSHYSSRY